jgi:uncharacterized RDD family membrane protein YckC
MNHKEAHFFHRLQASFIDTLIAMAIAFYFINLTVKSADIPELVTNLFLLLLVLLSPVGLLYQIFMTRWFGGTLGKLLTGIKITGLDGTTLAWKRIMFRQTIGYMFSSLLFGFGYLAILKNDKRQAWHDQAVGSLVIKTGNYWFIGLVVLLGLIGSLAFFGQQTVKTALANESLKQSFTQLIDDYQESSRPSGLDIRSEPKATVFINGEQKGETPYFDEKIAPGEYKINLKTTDPNAVEWEGTVTLVRGYMMTISRDLHKEVNAGEMISLTEGKGVKITSNPSEVQITIDGKPVGKTPFISEDLTTGDHEIILEKNGSIGRMITITIKDGYQTQLYMELGKANLNIQPKTKATPLPAKTTPEEKAEAIKYWQDELTYLNQESSNLPQWVGSEKDQTKIQRMITIVNEQKAFATKALAKSQKDETFSESEANEARKYAQMTEEYNKLLDEVFPR